MATTVEVRKECGYWSVYLNGRRTVQRESYQVAMNVAHCLEHPGYAIGTESREVADSIIAWLSQ